MAYIRDISLKPSPAICGKDEPHPVTGLATPPQLVDRVARRYRWRPGPRQNAPGRTNPPSCQGSAQQPRPRRRHVLGHAGEHVRLGRRPRCIAKRHPRAGPCTPTCGRFRARWSARWRWRARPGGAAYASAVHDRFAGLERYWDRFTWTPRTRRRYPASSVVAATSTTTTTPGSAWRSFSDTAWASDSSLRRAEQLWKFAQKGWDRSSGASIPGGVFWVQQRTGAGLSNHDRGTGATAWLRGAGVSPARANRQFGL